MFAESREWPAARRFGCRSGRPETRTMCMFAEHCARWCRLSAMELNIGGWLLLAVTSGLAAGLMNNLTSLLTGHLERAARSKERGEERSHASLLRREVAHEYARNDFLVMAKDLVEWAEELGYERFYEEVGDPIFRPPTGQKGLTGEKDALDALREIKYGHPSAEVRDKAQEMFDDVAYVYSEFLPDGEPASPLDLDKAKKWSGNAKALLESIHTPDAI